MSKFSDSFKRQIGRDTAKAFSNAIFGDRHSTPYRNVSQDRIVLKQKELEHRKEDFEKKNLYLIDNAVIDAVDHVIKLEISSDEKEIIKVSQALEIQLRVNKWMPVHKGEIAKVRNKYPDAVLKKFEQCLQELQYMEANPHRLEMMDKTFKKYRYLRFFQKYILFISIGLFLLISIIVGLIGG